MSVEHVITSRANPRFKAFRSLALAGGAGRTHTLLLGAKLIEAWAAAPQAGRLVPEAWFRLAGAPPHPLEQGLGLAASWELGEALMRDLAEAGSPPEHILLAALAPAREGPLPDRIIVPWGIQDPGNLGAILRAAAAFGFQEAILGPGCTDPFAPRALRGSMGAAFLMPLRRRDTLEPDPSATWLALDGGPDSLPLAQAGLGGRVRILVGNEGHGFTGAGLPPGIQRVAIPTLGVESLNAAVAAGIACYETARRAGLGGLG